MRKKIKHTCSLFFLLFIALLSNNKMQAETIVTASSKHLIIGASASKPHSEMEIVKLDVTSIGHATIQKKLFIPDLLQSSLLTRRDPVTENYIIKRSLLFTGHHLVHNYPFHCFW